MNNNEYTRAKHMFKIKVPYYYLRPLTDLGIKLNNIHII